MPTAVRQPAVAGRFYPANAQHLRAAVETFTTAAASASAESETKLQALGCVVPHAGYMYSGHVAGAVYRRLELPRRFVILCPNHTGMGEPLAIMSEGAWHTPLGDAPIDEELAKQLKSRLPLLSEDATAHQFEHALEVQLPFLQVLAPGFKFVPVTVGTSNFEVLSALGKVIGIAAAGAGHRLQRHEPLRERQGYAGERPPRHRSTLGARPARALRRRASGRYQHVRIRSCCRDADRSPQAGSHPRGVDSVCNFRRCLRRPRHGSRLRGSRGVLSDFIA